MIQRNITYLSKQETIRYFAFVNGLLLFLYKNRRQFPVSPIPIILWSSVCGSIDAFLTGGLVKLFDRFLDRNVKALISLSLLTSPLLYMFGEWQRRKNQKKKKVLGNKDNDDSHSNDDMEQVD